MEMPVAEAVVVAATPPPIEPPAGPKGPPAEPPAPIEPPTPPRRPTAEIPAGEIASMPLDELAPRLTELSQEQIAALPAETRANLIIAGGFTSDQLAGLANDPPVESAVDTFADIAATGGLGEFQAELNFNFAEVDAGRSGFSRKNLSRLADTVGRRIGGLLSAIPELRGRSFNDAEVVSRLAKDNKSKKPEVSGRAKQILQCVGMLAIIGPMMASSESK